MMTKTYVNDLTYKVIGCAIEVHKVLGHGLLESVYQECLKREFSLRDINFKCQLDVPINFKGWNIGTDYRLDFLIEDSLVLELKAIEGILPIHEAQLLTYMKLLCIPKGILINFHCTNIVMNGSKQMVNEYYSRLPD